MITMDNNHDDDDDDIENNEEVWLTKKYDHDINYDAKDGDLTQSDVECFEKYCQCCSQGGQSQKAGQHQHQGSPAARRVEKCDQNGDCCFSSLEPAQNEASPPPVGATLSTLLTFYLQHFKLRRHNVERVQIRTLTLFKVSFLALKWHERNSCEQLTTLLRITGWKKVKWFGGPLQCILHWWAFLHCARVYLTTSRFCQL